MQGSVPRLTHQKILYYIDIPTSSSNCCYISWLTWHCSAVHHLLSRLFCAELSIFYLQNHLMVMNLIKFWVQRSLMCRTECTFGHDEIASPCRNWITYPAEIKSRWCNFVSCNFIFLNGYHIHCVHAKNIKIGCAARKEVIFYEKHNIKSSNLQN